VCARRGPQEHPQRARVLRQPSCGRAYAPLRRRVQRTRHDTRGATAVALSECKKHLRLRAAERFPITSPAPRQRRCINMSPWQCSPSARLGTAATVVVSYPIFQSPIPPFHHHVCAKSCRSPCMQQEPSVATRMRYMPSSSVQPAECSSVRPAIAANVRIMSGRAHSRCLPAATLLATNAPVTFMPVIVADNLSFAVVALIQNVAL
jgi:hypothetical protein